MTWKYLYREGIGAHQRCLDIGCGSGLLTVQLARTGAPHVHAIDIDEAAVKNTLTNARFATDSPTASAPPRRTSTPGFRRSATT